MKNFTKLTAVILVLIIALLSTACSLTPQWSYKTDDTDLAIGVYIYALYDAYNQAQTFAQDTEGYDSEAGTYDGSKSFLKVQITDDDGVTATADQWISNKADETIRTLLAVEHEFARLGATVDEATMTSYKDYAKEYWDYGPYYSMYGEQYLNPYADVYEPLGVSYESFEYFYTVSAKQQAVFDALYSVDGEKAVSDKELTKYFEDNYTSYTYFNSNLYTTQEQVDDEGNTENVSVAMSEKKIASYKNNYKSYVNDINSGAKVSDVVDKFMDDYDIESDPSTSTVEILADSSIGENLVAEIEALNENEASYKIIGEGDSQVIYFFYKEAISKQIKNYIADETNRDSVLQNYKKDEFDSYLDSISESLDVQINSAVKKYSPKMFED